LPDSLLASAGSSSAFSRPVTTRHCSASSTVERLECSSITSPTFI
jgi:hypothetical protein